MADDQGIHLDDLGPAAGWHQPEAGWRSTNGEATLIFGGTSNLQTEGRCRGTIPGFPVFVVEE